jgi:hypothetical protein
VTSATVIDSRADQARAVRRQDATDVPERQQSSAGCARGGLGGGVQVARGRISRIDLSAALVDSSVSRL